MTALTLPSGPAFRICAQTPIVVDRTRRVFESEISGATQSMSGLGARFGWVVTFPPCSREEQRQREAFFLKLDGQENTLYLHDTVHPVPAGTCATTGVTVSTTAAQFARSMTLTGCGALATLKAGDWLGVAGGQIIRVVDDATANGSGVMAINFRHRLRYEVPSGAAITLLRPTAEFYMPEPPEEMDRGEGVSGPALTVKFLERW